MTPDRDIVCKGLTQDSFDAGRAKARDVMTIGIHCCREDDDLGKAVRHMEELQVRRLPVINKNKRMVGILSLGDVSNFAPGDLLSKYVRVFSASPLKYMGYRCADRKANGSHDLSCHSTSQLLTRVQHPCLRKL